MASPIIQSSQPQAFTRMLLVLNLIRIDRKARDVTASVEPVMWFDALSFGLEGSGPMGIEDDIMAYYRLQ